MAKSKIEIVSVIEIINGTVQTPSSFIIKNKINRSKIVKSAEELFLSCAKENGLEENSTDEALDNGTYSNNSGYEVIISWSQVENKLPVKKYYYLFGSSITRLYFDGEFSEVLDMIKNKPACDYSITEFTQDKDMLGDLLEAADGWGGHAEITKEEYNQIKKLEQSETELSDDQILEWYYTHDNEWRNDFMNDADADPADPRFYKYATEHYGEAIKKHFNL